MAENLKSSKGCEGKSENACIPKIIVQSGAYYLVFFKTDENEMLDAVKIAAKKGYSKMLNGGSAVDAVEEAVRILEDDIHFNAGRGSALNTAHKVECDAMIMDGDKLRTGAVMAGTNFKNPVKVARKIMDETDHCALSGEGARRFVQQMNYNELLCDPDELVVETSRQVMAMNFSEVLPRSYKEALPFDTVCAVALDKHGHFACATSTGGIPKKMVGRIGDAPLVGCGGYANKYGGAASSGCGEAIMKMTLARDVVFSMENGQSAMESATSAVQRMKQRLTKGYGSIIAIDKDGKFGIETNSPSMLWATCDPSQAVAGLRRLDDPPEN